MSRVYIYADISQCGSLCCGKYLNYLQGSPSKRGVHLYDITNVTQACSVEYISS